MAIFLSLGLQRGINSKEFQYIYRMQSGDEGYHLLKSLKKISTKMPYSTCSSASTSDVDDVPVNGKLIKFKNKIC